MERGANEVHLIDVELRKGGEDETGGEDEKEK